MKQMEKKAIMEKGCKENQNAGFTLVELLIAMMMTLLIVSSVGQFMASSSRNYQILDNQVNLQTEAQCTINMISDLILEGNNVRFEDLGKDKMLYIYKNLGTTDSTGNLVTRRTAEQDIVWYDSKSHNMYLFLCKNGSDYDNAKSAAHTGAKLLAEGVYDFNATAEGVDDWSNGLDFGRAMPQQPWVNISVKLQTKAVSDGNEDDFTYVAENSVFPRNEIVELP